MVEARSVLLEELFNKFAGPLDLASSIQVYGWFSGGTVVLHGVGTVVFSTVGFFWYSTGTIGDLVARVGRCFVVRRKLNDRICRWCENCEKSKFMFPDLSMLGTCTIDVSQMVVMFLQAKAWQYVALLCSENKLHTYSYDSETYPWVSIWSFFNGFIHHKRAQFSIILSSLNHVPRSSTTCARSRSWRARSCACPCCTTATSTSTSRSWTCRWAVQNSNIWIPAKNWLGIAGVVQTWRNFF